MSHSATVAFPAKGEAAREQNEDEQLMELLQSGEDDAGTERKWCGGAGSCATGKAQGCSSCSRQGERQGGQRARMQQLVRR